MKTEYRYKAAVQSKPIQIFVADQLQIIETVVFDLPYNKEVHQGLDRWFILMRDFVYAITGKQVDEESYIRPRYMLLTGQVDKKKREIIYARDQDISASK